MHLTILSICYIISPNLPPCLYSYTIPGPQVPLILHKKYTQGGRGGKRYSHDGIKAYNGNRIECTH